MSQKQLLLLTKGDSNAFSSLFDEYYPRLYSFCLKYLHNSAEAEDIVQDTFIRIWETRERIDPARPFISYLIAIAKNRIYDSIKQKIVAHKHRGNISETMWSQLYEDDRPFWDDIFKLMFSAIEQLP
ncbi:MAG: sigma-70 family RNA polymerase sigma factor, partial [Candidatus Cloacimonetes bacterium]|nr:sigma-70 family RNA polymerase sigma factor [Candidatus Cloacimonadota bacterium]